MARNVNLILTAISALALLALPACTGDSNSVEPTATPRVATPTITPFVPVPTAATPSPTPLVLPTPFDIPTPGPTPTPTPTPVLETPTPSQPTPTPTGIDMKRSGFPTALLSVNYTPGTAAELNADPYFIKISEDALKVPATFTILIADPFTFKGKVPQGEEPLYAFALRVENATPPSATLIESFEKALDFTLTSGNIGASAKFYRVSPQGDITPDPTALVVQPGKLTHPLSVTTVGWLITSAR